MRSGDDVMHSGANVYLGFRGSQLSLLLLQLHHSLDVTLQFADQVSELQDDLCEETREGHDRCERP